MTSFAGALVAFLALQATSTPDVGGVALAQRALERGDPGAAQGALYSVSNAERGFAWRHVALAVSIAEKSAKRTARGPSRDPLPAPITVLGAHSGAARALAWSPDGQRIASGGADRALRTWDPTSGLGVASHDVGAGVTALAWSPDSRRVAVACDDGSLHVLDAASGTEAFAVHADESRLGAVAWSRDGERIASGSIGGGVKLWDAAHGNALLGLHGHTSAIDALAFDAQGEAISASEDGTVRVWNGDGGARLVLRDHSGAVRALAVDAAGEAFVSGATDSTVRSFDARSGLARIVGTAPAQISGVAVEPQSARLAAVTIDGHVCAWSANGAPLVELAIATRPLTAISFAPDGNRLAVCGEDGLVRVLETDLALARSAQEGATLVLPGPDAARKMKARELDAITSRIARHAGLRRDMYESAEQLQRALCERVPDAGELESTLGALVFRQDRYAEARDLLVAAQEKTRGLPLNLAFRAMAHARCGEVETARSVLAKLDIVLQEPRWRDDADLATLRAEVERTVAAAQRG